MPIPPEPNFSFLPYDTLALLVYLILLLLFADLCIGSIALQRYERESDNLDSTEVLLNIITERQGEKLLSKGEQVEVMRIRLATAEKRERLERWWDRERFLWWRQRGRRAAWE